MAKKIKYIMLCKEYNNSRNVLFQMYSDDFRFNNGNYTAITRVVKQLPKRVTPNGHRATPVIADNGKTYLVYNDWSAVEVNEVTAIRR